MKEGFGLNISSFIIYTYAYYVCNNSSDHTFIALCFTFSDCAKVLNDFLIVTCNIVEMNVLKILDT